jgi:hypothetical protein
MIARVFPAHRSFVRKVIAEGIEPARNFPSGPYPNDKLVYRSKGLVELLKNTDPIRGVAMLVGLVKEGEPSLLFLAVRFPSEIAGLSSAIIQQAEYEGTHLKD